MRQMDDCVTGPDPGADMEETTSGRAVLAKLDEQRTRPRRSAIRSSPSRQELFAREVIAGNHKSDHCCIMPKKFPTERDRRRVRSDPRMIILYACTVVRLKRSFLRTSSLRCHHPRVFQSLPHDEFHGSSPDLSKVRPVFGKRKCQARSLTPAMRSLSTLPFLRASLPLPFDFEAVLVAESDSPVRTIGGGVNARVGGPTAFGGAPSRPRQMRWPLRERGV